MFVQVNKLKFTTLVGFGEAKYSERDTGQTEYGETEETLPLQCVRSTDTRTG